MGCPLSIEQFDWSMLSRLLSLFSTLVPDWSMFSQFYHHLKLLFHGFYGESVYLARNVLEMQYDIKLSLSLTYMILPYVTHLPHITTLHVMYWKCSMISSYHYNLRTTVHDTTLRDTSSAYHYFNHLFHTFYGESVYRACNVLEMQDAIMLSLSLTYNRTWYFLT